MPGSHANLTLLTEESHIHHRRTVQQYTKELEKALSPWQQPSLWKLQGSCDPQTRGQSFVYIWLSSNQMQKRSEIEAKRYKKTLSPDGFKVGVASILKNYITKYIFKRWYSCPGVFKSIQKSSAFKLNT